MIRRHALTTFVGVLALVTLATGRVTRADTARAIDLDLILVLFALLVSVELLRASGWLDFAVAATVARFHRTRSFAMALIALSGVLASLVTNDVALFIVIPFTVVASRFAVHGPQLRVSRVDRNRRLAVTARGFVAPGSGRP